MAREFCHTCERLEGGADEIETATFNFYASRYPVTITKSACGID